MSLARGAEAHAALERNYATNRDETKWLVGRIGQINVYGMLIENPNTSEVFLQCFDKAATGDVTLGTTVADFTLGLPASGKVVFDQLRPLFHFNKGCVMAITTTRTGATAITSDCTASIYYSQS